MEVVVFYVRDEKDFYVSIINYFYTFALGMWV